MARLPVAQLHAQHLCALCTGFANWGQCTGAKSGRHIFHCDVCKPAARPFADMSDRDQKAMQCDAVYQASPKIGEFLERRGKLDFSKMTENEWYDFLHKVVDEYRAAIRDITKRLY